LTINIFSNKSGDTKTKLSPFKTFVADLINKIQLPPFVAVVSILVISLGLHKRIFFISFLLGITIF